jgi:hypothetical protein
MPQPNHYYKRLDSVNPATLDQKSEISQAITRRNLYFDQMLESLFGVLISVIISRVAYRCMTITQAGEDALVQWMDDLGKASVMPYLISFSEQYPYLFLDETPLTKYSKFKKIIGRLSSRLSKDAYIHGITASDHKHVLSYQQDLAEMVGTQNTFVIQRFYNIASFGVRKGNSLATEYTAAFLIVTTPFLRKLIIDPLLRRVRHRIYDLCFSTPHAGSLSQDDAKIYLKLLIKGNRIYRKWGMTGLFVLQNLILLITGYAVLTFYMSSIWIDPEFFIFIFSNSIILAEYLLQDWLLKRKEKHLAQELNTSCETFRSIVVFTGSHYQIHRGSSRSACYLKFVAAPFASLSNTLVNQVVKDIFLTNQIRILHYSNSSHTVELQSVDKEKVLQLKTVLTNTLQRYNDIKILAGQVSGFFTVLPITKNIGLVNGLPVATFIINTRLSAAHNNILKKSFVQCDISCTDDTIIISGHLSSERDVLISAFRANNTKVPYSPQFYRRPGYKRSADPAPVMQNNIERLIVPEVKTYHWPRYGSYSTANTNGEIRPLIHNAYRNDFLLFAIHPDYFPRRSDHDNLKSKVLEGRLASNAKGRQGLQFRPEQAYDLTQPGHPHFFSVLRYKALGNKNDWRLYAKQVTSPDGNLYVFCGMNLSAH